MDEMSKEDLLKLVITYAQSIVVMAEKLEDPNLKPLPKDELMYIAMLKQSAGLIVTANEIANKK
jgi:hypothetical protein